MNNIDDSGYGYYFAESFILSMSSWRRSLLSCTRQCVRQKYNLFVPFTKQGVLGPGIKNESPNEITLSDLLCIECAL
ncbi:unnamed protein product [Acanthoscelides obtectus]|uniref:Uncharacterized protein n=1 Tax=Acanthoscelides obtectus TaxID=200917 RepID=A0A9P0L0C4_ACAOB|nr:unnamed protein product [Acanthoscelides obtectus]CAK1660702.1 hypothetical protein AOBTE_LOCUS22224 [Acanthoscelides obtectus]